MKYVGEKEYQHGMDTKVGVLITNLGTPDAPTKTRFVFLYPIACKADA